MTNLQVGPIPQVTGNTHPNPVQDLNQIQKFVQKQVSLYTRNRNYSRAVTLSQYELEALQTFLFDFAGEHDLNECLIFSLITRKF